MQFMYKNFNEWLQSTKFTDEQYDSIQCRTAWKASRATLTPDNVQHVPALTQQQRYKKLKWFKDNEPIPEHATYIRSECIYGGTLPDRHLYEVME